MGRFKPLKAFGNVDSSQIFHIFILLVYLQIGSLGVHALEDDIFYFTSFRDVEEWPQVYCQCNIDCKYNEKAGVDPATFPFTISPIALPKESKASQMYWRNGTHYNVKVRDHDTVLLIYNNPPPPIGSFSVSYGFQKTKECLVNTFFSPCYVSPSFGRVRGVVLNAERVPLKTIKEDFTVEDPELFVSILNGGSKNEKKFYEAIFMGSTMGSHDKRSTHTIDGKSYPMEIYMYFIDETLPAMAAATVLVVLVEESEETNPRVNPISNAVANNLYQMERKFLRENDYILRRERGFHHMEVTSVEDPFNLNPKLAKDRIQNINSSVNIETETCNMVDHWERIQSLLSKSIFDHEDLTSVLKRRNELEEQTYWTYSPIYHPDALEFMYVLRYFHYHSIMRKLCAQPSHFEEDCKPYEEYDPPIDEKYWNLEKRPEYKFVIEPMKRLIAALEKFYNGGRYITPKTVVDQYKIRDKSKLLKKAEENLYVLQRQLYDALFFTVVPIKRMPNKYKYQMGLYLPFVRYYDVQRDYVNYYPTHAKLENKLIQVGVEMGIPNFFKRLINEDFKGMIEYIQIFSEEAIIEPFHLLRNHKYKKTGKRKYGNMAMSEEDYQAYEKMRPTKFYLKNNFQVSWLLPKGGGYYVYKGSSPVPPCFQAETVIVFKKPIKMSKEQIEALSTVPTSPQKNKDIRNTLGRLNKLRRPDIPIYFDKRNHQFMRDDGVHKNSVIAAQERHNATESGQNNISQTSSLTTIIGMFGIMLEASTFLA